MKRFILIGVLISVLVLGIYVYSWARRGIGGMGMGSSFRPHGPYHPSGSGYIVFEDSGGLAFDDSGGVNFKDLS